MLGRVATAALFLQAVSCNGDSAERTSDRPATIRVAVADLTGIESILDLHAGSVAHLYELLFEPATDHLELVERDGVMVSLRRARHSRYSATELAEAFRCRDQIQALASEDGVVVELDSIEAAGNFSLAASGIAVGPYRASDVEGLLRLEPQDTGSNKPVLDFLPAPRDDHWRLLAGHHVDVAPRIGARATRFLEGVQSIQTTDYPTRSRVYLLLNSKSDKLAALSSRTAIVSALDSAALGQVVCGTESCDTGWEARTTTADSVALPHALSLIALAGSKDEELAAKVISHQVWSAYQIRVGVDLLDVRELSRRLHTRNYELILIPGPVDPRHLLESFATQLDDRDGPIALARARADWNAALDEIYDQARLVPLWNQQFYAAVDSSVCGARPDSATSWLWLADLHFCDDGVD